MTGMIPRFCPHCNGPLDVFRVVEWGGWTFDEEAGLLLPGGEGLRLTENERNLLGALLRAGGRKILKSGGLYAAICGDRPDVDWPDIKIVDVYISKLRTKLRIHYQDEVLISTQWGVGYYATPVGQKPSVPAIVSHGRGGRPKKKRTLK